MFLKLGRTSCFLFRKTDFVHTETALVLIFLFR